MVASRRWMVATGSPVARPSSLTPRASPGSASASSSSRARSTDWTPSPLRWASAAALGRLVATTSLLMCGRSHGAPWQDRDAHGPRHQGRDRDELKDLNVGVTLSGDLADVHLTGDNANVVPTDT